MGKQSRNSLIGSMKRQRKGKSREGGGGALKSLVGYGKKMQHLSICHGKISQNYADKR